MAGKLAESKFLMINLKEKINQVRKNIIEVTVKNGAGHIASSLSTVEVLVALYYEVMNIRNIKPSNPEWENRDRLIFSKAHGCYALYSILSDIGFVPREEWDNFYKGSSLAGCTERNEEYGLEVGCGSLGHGLPMAVGIAFGAKLQNKSYRIYCIVGDGELQEGSMWEAIQFAVKHKLSNLTVIVDNNRLQAMDFLQDVLTENGVTDDIERKMSAFGFTVKTSDGHDISKITSILEEWKNDKNLTRPQVLVANTIKGYGLKCMENIPKFHFRLPTEEELKMGNRYE